MRLIDADELKKNYANAFVNAFGIGCAKMFIGVINQTPTAGWIPCSERLPEDGQTVDVTFKEDYGNGEYTLHVFETCYHDAGWGMEDGSDRYNSEVIAWKPKDAPYQPEGALP